MMKHNNTIFVDATLNQKENVTLMLDTGSNHTILTPKIASLLGISPKKDEPTYSITLIGGETIEVPFVSLSEIKVGEAVVKKLMIGVYSVFPDMPALMGS